MFYTNIVLPGMAVNVEDTQYEDTYEDTEEGILLETEESTLFGETVHEEEADINFDELMDDDAAQNEEGYSGSSDRGGGSRGGSRGGRRGGRRGGSRGGYGGSSEGYGGNTDEEDGEYENRRGRGMNRKRGKHGKKWRGKRQRGAALKFELMINNYKTITLSLK